MRPDAQRLNVLFVAPAMPTGGVTVLWAYLLRGLAARGHAVSLLAAAMPRDLAARDWLPTPHGLQTVERYPVPYIPVVLAADPAFRRLEGAEIAARLPTVLGRDQPDVVVIGCESGVWRVPPTARAHCLPSVIVIHGSTTLEVLFESRGAGGLGGRLRAKLKSVDVLITVAHHLADELMRVGLRDVRVIPNPVDLARFRPGPASRALRRELGVSDDRVVVAHVSNLKVAKRPLDVVASAALALRQDPRLLYLIVGDGPERTMMEQACRERGVADRFRFVGWVEHERVADYLRLADVVVMPSATEGQALVYLEAQASGAVLVASDIPGVREVVVDGETGLLFKLGDVEALAAKTLSVARDRVLREAIARQARTAVVVHELDACVTRYEIALMEAVRGLTHRPQVSTGPRSP